MPGLSAILGNLPGHPCALCQAEYTIPCGMHPIVPASSCHSWRVYVVLPQQMLNVSWGAHSTVTAGLPSYGQVATSAEVILT